MEDKKLKELFIDTIYKELKEKSYKVKGVSKDRMKDSFEIYNCYMRTPTISNGFKFDDKNPITEDKVKKLAIQMAVDLNKDWESKKHVETKFVYTHEKEFIIDKLIIIDSKKQQFKTAITFIYYGENVEKGIDKELKKINDKQKTEKTTKTK